MSSAEQLVKPQQQFQVRRVKKRIIMGNTSVFVPEDKRESHDSYTHKWMLYIRGPKEDPDISKFVSLIRVYLHPSFKPNDVVELTAPPYHLNRRGYGEFDIKIHVHLRDRSDAEGPVEVVHRLKLDKQCTGKRMIHDETVLEIEVEEKVPMSIVLEQQRRQQEARMKMEKGVAPPTVAPLPVATQPRKELGDTPRETVNISNSSGQLQKPEPVQRTLEQKAEKGREDVAEELQATPPVTSPPPPPPPPPATTSTKPVASESKEKMEKKQDQEKMLDNAKKLDEKKLEIKGKRPRTRMIKDGHVNEHSTKKAKLKKTKKEQSPASASASGSSSHGTTKKEKKKQTFPPTTSHPLISYNSLDRELSQEEQYIFEAAQKYLLISNAKSSNYLCAKSDEEFVSWSLGKRKAAERLRSLLIKKYMKQKNKATQWSTATISKFCRLAGYTPIVHHNESVLDLLQAQEKIKAGPEAIGKRDTLAHIKKRALREEGGTRYCKYCGIAHKPQSDFHNAQLQCAKRYKLDTVINSCPRSIDDYVQTIVSLNHSSNNQGNQPPNTMMGSSALCEDTSQFFFEEDSKSDGNTRSVEKFGSTSEDITKFGSNGNGASCSNGSNGIEKASSEYPKAVSLCHAAYKEESLLVRKLANQMGVLKQDKPASPQQLSVDSPQTQAQLPAQIGTIDQPPQPSSNKFPPPIQQENDKTKAAPESISIEQKATELALVKALKCFMRSLVKESLAIFQEQKRIDGEQESKDKILVPFHTYFAILKNPELYDFLTNNFKTLVNDEADQQDESDETPVSAENGGILGMMQEEQDEMDVESFTFI